MLFNSIDFLIFFPIVTSLYYLLPHRFRWLLLLTASCVFYMFFIPIYILILFITIIIDYYAGIWIEKSGDKRNKKFLVASIISKCLILFIFKYFNFFNANMQVVAQFFHWNYTLSALEVVLPIGISFHTFQSLSYVIEVYRKNQKAEHNFGIYALYVMFYPQLVAGPIERPKNLLHQFYEEHKFNYGEVSDGIKLMLWGFFQKVVIADRLAVFVNQVYNHPHDFQGISLIIATVFFAFQIYCDFSGYSDIAIGAAQTMGFKLMNNFNRPYFSKSISEFWKRWHISLSSWFRDYLYISLGGNRVAKPRWYFNLFFTFLVSGIWHGANWTFIIWGALNGFYLLFGIMTKEIRNKISKFFNMKNHLMINNYISVFFTFTLICIGWVFFRANNVYDAIYILSHILSGYHEAFRTFSSLIAALSLGVSRYDFGIAITSLFVLLGIHLIQRHGSIRHMLSCKPVLIRWGTYYCLVMSILVFGYFINQQFIYFQF